jgi:hypothetical protein
MDVDSFADVSEAHAAFLFGFEVVNVDGKLKPSPFSCKSAGPSAINTETP